MSNAVFRSSHMHELKPDTYLSLVFRTQTLVSGYPQVVAAFKEIKVLKVKVWAYTSLSTSSPGTLTMITCPMGLAQKNSTQKLAVAAPGAITRKIWQPLHGVYFPTEPSERDWLPIDTQHLVFDLEFFPWNIPVPAELNEVQYAQIQIIVDAHVMLRGQRNGVLGTAPISTTIPYADLPRFLSREEDPPPSHGIDVSPGCSTPDPAAEFERLDLDSSLA